MKSRSRKQKRILRELEKNPLIERACKKVGIARSTYYRWCLDDPSFKINAEEAQNTGREKMNDFVESKLLESIGLNSIQAIRFWLTHNTTRYGYVNAEELKRLRSYEYLINELSDSIVKGKDDEVLRLLHSQLELAKQLNAKYGTRGL